MAQDISNQSLFARMSAETVITLLVLLLGGATAWQALASDVEEVKKDAQTMQVRQKHVEDDISEVNVTLAEISARQDANTRAVIEVKDDLKYIRQLLDKAYK